MKPTKHEYRTIDAKEAKQLIAKVDPNWQRDLAVGQEKHLARLIKLGLFGTGHVVLAKVNGAIRVANGMHTLHAIERAGGAARVLIEWYRCRNNEDYVQLFHMFDTENRKRSNKDSAKAFLMGYSEKLPEVSPTLLSMFRSGVEQAKQMMAEKRVRPTQHERYKAVLSYEEEFNFFLSLDSMKAHRELLNRSAIIAAVILTYQANAELAQSFWEQVVTGFFDKKDPSHPPVLLNRYLRTVVCGGVNSSTMKKNMILVPRKHLYAACIRAWNAFADGRALKVLKPFSNPKKPVLPPVHG